MALNLIAEIISPTMAMALTAGPASPEFSSFEPVATTDMVNDFTGDFTYNIPVVNVPGPDGGDYALSLAYHSGASSEEEASWVGFGWTLNPGAINRNKRGYPDEYKGVEVVNYNKRKPNYTVSARFDLNLEVSSNDQKSDNEKAQQVAQESLKKAGQILKVEDLIPKKESGKSDQQQLFSVSLNHSIRYNNYSGFSIANNFGVGVLGLANLSMNREGKQTTLGFSVNPLNIARQLKKMEIEQLENLKYKDERALAALSKAKARLDKLNFKNMKPWLKKILGRMPSLYPMQFFNTPAVPYSVAKTYGSSWNFSSSAQFNLTGPVGVQAGVAGNMHITATEGEETDLAYGYLHSAESNSNTAEKVFYDYQLEKESTFSRQDKNLGLAFNNADVFSASGNDVIGGFRLHHQSIGTYYPNLQTNLIENKPWGVEYGLGQVFQIGLDIGKGNHTTSIKGQWPKLSSGTNMATKKFSPGNLAEMRFANDPGGELDYCSMYDYDANIYGKVTKLKKLDLDNSFNLSLDTSRTWRSSQIYYDYESDPGNAAKNYITGLHVVNKDGGRSHYDQAVYTRNETQLSIGLEAYQDGEHIVYHPLNFDDPMDNNTVTGQKAAEKYASTYLLTSNTKFNYVDADTAQGPSDGDFGGWTKFGYRQSFGGAGAWYRYRTPYTGLYYNEGRMLDNKDQTGGMSSGEKEVYYLKCIESRSHIAFFITNRSSAASFTTDFPAGKYPGLYSGGQPVSTLTTNLQGSGNDRYDGIDAAAIAGSMDPSANSSSAKGTHRPEMLERIVLYAKSDLSRPLSTTYFEYDYSICPGIPNFSAPGGYSGPNGKLTLKRLWSEGNGVQRSQIAPYRFDYTYFDQYPAHIKAKYPWADTSCAGLIQNPPYDPNQLDAWGNYRENGYDRHRLKQFWVSQRDPSTSFDPGAWQLKRIQLPSGGEIHVQYEQKDYVAFQDHRPFTMVSLKADPANEDGFKSNESTFCINLEDLRIDNGNEVMEYFKVLQDHFLVKLSKLYFKVLYTYSGDDEPQLNAGGERYEYVTGYVSVNDIRIDGTKIFFDLGDTRKKGGKKNDKTLPRWVCYQEMHTNGGINLGTRAEDYTELDQTGAVYQNNPVQVNDVKEAAKKDLKKHIVNIFKDWVSTDVRNAQKKDACRQINFAHSYFKLPVLYAKKGGGIRVKRLLSYDPGIASESGSAALFGMEYWYKTLTGQPKIPSGQLDFTVPDIYESNSSGVAINEPPELREESALVGFIERKKQKWLNKISNGRDTKQFEGFMGESILPPAQVGHASVIIQNIHSEGKTNTGFTVHTYKTARYYPVESDWSDLEKKEGTYRRLGLHIPLGMFNMNIDKAWATQGYLFKLNDMHGKLESVSTYPGYYRESGGSYGRASSSTEYRYSEPGSAISSMIYDPATETFKGELLRPGTEEDYTIYSSAVNERSNDFSIEVDLNASFVAPSVWPSIGGVTYSYFNNQLCQHVTSKVVSQRSYLLSVSQQQDGVVKTTETIAFDKYTGDPVLSKTYDGYATAGKKIFTQNDGGDRHAGYYYTLNIPASWMYPGMAPKRAPGSTAENRLTELAGHVTVYGGNAMIGQIVSTGSWSPSSNPLTGVTDASATTYTTNWFTDNALYNEYPNLAYGGNTLNAIPAATVAANRIHYPKQTYHYRETVKDANASGGRIYEGGATTANFKFFDWANAASPPPEWYSDSRVTSYSPHGNAVEEIDALGIKSSVLFGYNHTLPSAVAKNAALAEIRFNDFEYGHSNEQGYTTSTAHSGRVSHNFSADPAYKFAKNYTLNLAKGLGLKVWMKSVMPDGLKNPNPKPKAWIGGQGFDFVRIAQTGEWTLYSADIRNFNGIGAGPHDIFLAYNKQTNEQVYMDDFRAQPLDAAMTCFVYHADNKPAVQFDDQHFGVFYEYDHKGQLVRKSIETERGKKTLQEQQYNTPLVLRKLN